MILDIHTHLFPEEVCRNRSFFCRRDEGFRLIYENPKARLVGWQELLKVMDRDHVDQSVICGFPWKDPGSKPRRAVSRGTPYRVMKKTDPAGICRDIG